MAGTGQGQYPFLYPTPYAPAQFGLGNSDMGSLVAMFAGPLLEAAAGPENFIPHLMPTQNLMDQHAMRNYQREMLTSSLSVAGGARGPVAQGLLGMRSAFTDDPVTQLNREQADTAAGVLTHPIVKAIASSVMGPETLEAAMYGSKGDITSLNSAIAKTGFFRSDPMGGQRMTADSLTSFTEGVYSHLYEQEGNLDSIEADARKKRGINPMRNGRIDEARQKLKDAAGKPEADIINDEEVVTRMVDMDNADAEVSRMYKKYVKNGTAVTTEERAKELSKFDRAVDEAGVLDRGETTIGQLRKAAEQAPVNRMHGFMAGQVGQMQQELFERGLMPEAVGHMSADDRMRTVGETQRDDETVERLARKMVRADFEKTDPAFKSLSSEQQDRLIDTKTPEAVKELRKTEKEATKYARGDADAMSIEDLEKQGGMDLLTVDADSSRAAGTLEKYSGALGAIRDLFGDNGNPNAPVPALLKMLDALTNGTAGQFEPGRVEAELRKMQSLAKETGVGMNQLAQLSTNVTMQGRMFGLNDASAVQGTNATLAAIKVMQESGAFSTGRFGAMNKEQAMESVSRSVQAGAASNNAKAAATLARLYDADPQKYAGTELEAAVEAYRDPNSEGVYTDPTTGEQKNLVEMIGRYGPGAARDIFVKSNNGKGSGFDSAFYDPLTEEKTLDNKLFGYQTQAVEGRQFAYNATRSVTADELETDDKLFSGVDPQERGKRFDLASGVVNQMILDTGDKSPAERKKYFDTQLEVEVAQKLKDSGVGDAEAEAQAKEFAGRFKNDPALIDNYASAAGMALAAIPGADLNLVTYAQKYGRGAAHEFAQESARAGARAEQKKNAAMGHESGPVQRISDYFREIGESGEKFTLSGFMESAAPHIKNSEVAQKYMSKMEPGFEALGDRMKDVFVTDSYIDTLAENKNYDELMKLADPTGNLKKAKTRVISGKELDTARNKTITKRYDKDGAVDEDAVARDYKQLVGGSGEGMSTEEKLQELRLNDEFMESVDREVRHDQNAISEAQLVKEARGAKGDAREGQEARAERLQRIEASYFYGKDAEKTKEGVSSALREFDVKMTDEEIREYQDLVLDSSEEGKRKLNEKIDEDISGWQLNKEDTEDLRSVLNAQQEARNIDPASLGLTDKQSGMMKQTDEGVVDQTSIDAQTVVLHGVRFVDDNGKEISLGGSREEAAVASMAIRDRANAMVDEHYSRVDSTGNSSAFSDNEVKDAAMRLSDELGISRESATEMMQGIQEERAKNSGGIGLGYFVGDNLEYSKEKQQKHSQQAKEIVGAAVGDKKSMSSAEVNDAVKKMSAASKISEEEARAFITGEISAQKIDTPDGKSGKASKPTDTSSTDKPKPDQIAEKPKPVSTDSTKTAAAAVKAVYEKEGVKAATGVAYERPSKEDASRFAEGASRVPKYDYKELGVTEKVTPQQKELIDRFAGDSTGKKFSAEMSSVFGGKTREAMFTLPDKAALELFDKFDPEAQKQGLAQLKEARNNGLLTENQRKNASRLYDVISEDQNKPAIERLSSAKPITYAYKRPPGVDRGAGHGGRDNFDPTTAFTRPTLDGPGVALAEELRSSSRIGAGRESAPTGGRATEDVARLGGGLQGSPAGLGSIEQMVRQLNVQPAAGGAASGNQEVRLTGTLSLNGLQEAMLAATSSRSVHIDGGAPIVKDPAPMMSAPGGSKNA